MLAGPSEELCSLDGVVWIREMSGAPWFGCSPQDDIISLLLGDPVPLLLGGGVCQYIPSFATFLVGIIHDLFDLPLGLLEMVVIPKWCWIRRPPQNWKNLEVSEILKQYNLPVDHPNEANMEHGMTFFFYVYLGLSPLPVTVANEGL